jgi:hypothetical protein
MDFTFLSRNVSSTLLSGVPLTAASWRSSFHGSVGALLRRAPGADAAVIRAIRCWITRSRSSTSSSSAARRCWCRSSSSTTASASSVRRCRPVGRLAVPAPALLVRHPGADPQHRGLCGRDHPAAAACRCRSAPGGRGGARKRHVAVSMLYPPHHPAPSPSATALPAYGSEIILMVTRATALDLGHHACWR